MQRFLCNSPLYDPNSEDLMKSLPSTLDQMEIDKYLEYKNEGVFPGFGTFHMYHRIDG